MLGTIIQYLFYMLRFLASLMVPKFSKSLIMPKSSFEMLPLKIGKATKAFPTGDPSFAVMRPFSGLSGFSSEECDPFLMCDQFGPTKASRIMTHEDSFLSPWHPHRGFDVMTYLKEGITRHADSLGNRGYKIPAPSIQWTFTGSGIEHAEGGDTPVGQPVMGFQIWVNVPSAVKMEDPVFGFESKDGVPTFIPAAGIKGTVLVGKTNDRIGPLPAKSNSFIADYEFLPSIEHKFKIRDDHDQAILYVYKGEALVGETTMEEGEVVRFDADDATRREITVVSGVEGASILLFSGKKLRQSIAWHGPFVMTTNSEIQQAMSEYQSGSFLKKRAPWDYRVAAATPKDKLMTNNH